MARAQVVDQSTKTGVIELRLCDFPINSSKLRPSHVTVLGDRIAPLLAKGGSISILGLASRSGSSSHNQRLSERRAQSVIEQLKLLARRNVNAKNHTGKIKSVAGVGESAAAKAGQRDGTEDAFYRAVLIKAWARRVPPPAPKPKPPVKKVKRVASRKWFSSSTFAPGLGGPMPSGEDGALLADLLSKAIATKKRGGTDSRTYTEVPPDYAVVRVNEFFMIDESLWTPPVKTTRYRKEVHYKWGTRTERVRVRTTTIWKTANDRLARVDKTDQTYHRSRVWKVTTHPDAAVFG